MRKLSAQRGSILILALWTLTFLGVFAAHIGLRIRQRATLLSRLETRSQLHYVVTAGVKKAISSLKMDFDRQNKEFTPYGKFFRHNNEERFSSIVVGNGSSDVSYPFYRDDPVNAQERYGIIDEESKINLNVADRDMLKRLFSSIGSLDDDQTVTLAEAIIDWRELGASSAEGFYSDSYYENLEFPYQTKDADFELMDELLLVQGMTEDILERIKPFVTIYGDGKVNINTAPKTVLLVLGFDAAVVDKILTVRRGLDALESTVDDHIFTKTYDIASDIKQSIELTNGEMTQIDQMNKTGKIKLDSQYFLIQAKAKLEARKEVLEVACVYNSKEERIEYWREK